MEREPKPQFLREFTKEESADERKKTADAIRATRKHHFERKKSRTESHEKLQQEISERESAIELEQKRVEEMEKQIEDLSANGLSRVLNFLHLRKLRADVRFGERNLDELKHTQLTGKVNEEILSEKISGPEANAGLEQARYMLESFYKDEGKKWANAEYSREDVEENFTEEHLASLDVDEYALLLKRFSGKMVAHVTRQGIRDHTGMIYHMAGVDEYSDGFMKMLEDGRLRSPLGIHLVEKEKEKALANYLRLDSFENKEEALEHLEKLIDPDSQGQGTYSDKMAVHFATEQVADHLYGSERGNEIFVAYPSEYIASQYYYNGQLIHNSGDKWNDQWVWANEERGMDLNAGLVFISAEAKVSKKTGSRYELDENNKPIKNQEYENLIMGFVNSPNFIELAEKISKQYSLDVHWTLKDKEIAKALKPFREMLAKDFNITDERLQTAVLDFQNLEELRMYKESENKGGEYRPYHKIENTLDGILRSEGILYVEAQDSVSSQEFWENYFKEHPGQRPSKIVFYKGQDPTKALEEWKNRRWIGKDVEDKDLGFSEKLVKVTSPQAVAGMSRFESLARKVIEDYFEEKEK